MTIDETIAHCEDVVNTNKELCERDNDFYKNQVQIQCSYEHQQLAEWLKELKYLKEKDEAKAVRYEGDGYADGKMVYDMAYCPCCNHYFEEDSENWECEFCPNCGQRLRWEE